MRRVCLLASVLLAVSPALAASFRMGRPVWPTGRERDMNVTAGARAVIDAPPGEPVVLRVTAATIYRAFVNGHYRGHGPARGPHGFFRVDEWDIARDLRPGQNVIAIEVAGYNANSYAYLDQPSFLQAEVMAGDLVLAGTGVDTCPEWKSAREDARPLPFVLRVLPERVQKVQRYSFQRPFSEVYRLTPGFDAWRSDSGAVFEPTDCSVLTSGGLLDRRVPYPAFRKRPANWRIAEGEVAQREKLDNVWKDRSLTAIGPTLKGYPEGELAVIPSIELQKFTSRTTSDAGQALTPETTLKISANRYQTVDFGTNFTGFLGAEFRCDAPTELHITFDEILTEGQVDFKRLGCVNIISLQLDPGTYAFESMEPYTLRYAKLIVLKGACDIRGLYLRELVTPDVDLAHFASSDVRLNRLFDAGRETYRQNAVDIFMDCPSRERAGWLCDSFFTSRVAKDLSGHTRIEKNFCENFLLPASFPKIDAGMLPMCYPSDHYNGEFIPNWAMWFVIELEEYAARSGDRQLVDALKPRVLALLEFLWKFRNEDGLLEKLPSWVFVEWSAANGFVQDVNYPSNALWAGTLAATGRLYKLPDLTAEADKVRETIRRQSFDGHFFVDNAVRKAGKLEITRNRSETCQYYLFFFDVARPETHGELWRILADEFGPKRVEQKRYPEIHPSNSFIGNMLRMEILSRAGRSQQILDESIDYLLYMAERTGTLWENVKPEASCNHGFASHIVHTLYRDILGVRRLDTINHALELRIPEVKIDWCEGRLPTPDGLVTLRWWKQGGQVQYRLDMPAGYGLRESHAADLEVHRQR